MSDGFYQLRERRSVICREPPIGVSVRMNYHRLRGIVKAILMVAGPSVLAARERLRLLIEVVRLFQDKCVSVRREDAD
jgi:hypothetical protein